MKLKRKSKLGWDFLAHSVCCNLQAILILLFITGLIIAALMTVNMMTRNDELYYSLDIGAVLITCSKS